MLQPNQQYSLLQDLVRLVHISTEQASAFKLPITIFVIFSLLMSTWKCNVCHKQQRSLCPKDHNTSLYHQNRKNRQYKTYMLSIMIFGSAWHYLTTI